MWSNLKTPLEKRKREKTPAEKRPGKDPKHLANVRKLPCCVCGEPAPSDCHHVKAAGGRGMGMKSKDSSVVPLCRHHHDLVERAGSRNEITWFESYGIAPLTLAKALWDSRHDLDAMVKVLDAHRG